MEELFPASPPQTLPAPNSPRPLDLTFEPFQTRIFWIR